MYDDLDKIVYVACCGLEPHHRLSGIRMVRDPLSTPEGDGVLNATFPLVLIAESFGKGLVMLELVGFASFASANVMTHSQESQPVVEENA